MLPPIEYPEEPKLPGLDNDQFTFAVNAGKPAKRNSLRGNSFSLGTGSGDNSLNSLKSSRDGSLNSQSRLQKSVSRKQVLWDNNELDVPMSNSFLPLQDDPALLVLDDVALGKKESESNAWQKMSPSASQKKQYMNAADRWEAVKSKVKLVGKLQVDSQNVKHYGVELDMSSSFGTTHDDFVHQEVTRCLYVNPDGQFRSGWDIAQVMVLFYLAWVTPYRVGFDAPAYGPEFWFEFLVDIYFIVDVFLNFITGFWLDLETTTVLVSDPSEIGKNYLKTWFLIDIVACAPVDLATRAIEGELACSFSVNGCPTTTAGSVNSSALKLFKLLRIFRLLKLLRLFRVSRLLNRYQNTLIYYHSFISVGRVNLLVILISHWIGCLFGLLHNWDVQQVTDKSTRWLLSVYWAVQSITSVGYGDIPAENPYTQVLSLFTMLIGVVLVSWIMTNVLAAMNPDSSARRFHERLQYVLAYLKNNQLPSGVAKRVITFYRWQNMNQFDEKSVLSDLPAQLRKDIFDNLYTDALKDVAIFSGCSSQFMTEVSLRMAPISFPQFQTVYCKGELGSKMYFITKGSVALILREVIGQSSQEDFAVLADSCLELGRGSFFGEAAVLGHPSRLETIVTTRSSTMMTLRFQDMTELCQLSFEFKAKLAIIAFERMRRNRMSREIVEYCAREFGLDPEEFIVGTEKAEADEEDKDVDGNFVRSVSTRYNGATHRVVFVNEWKTLVVDRVCNSLVASVGKIFTTMGLVQANVEHIFNRLQEMDEQGGVLAGKKTEPPAGANGAQKNGQIPSVPGAIPPIAPTSDVNQRLTALETKMDTLIALLEKKENK